MCLTGNEGLSPCLGCVTGGAGLGPCRELIAGPSPAPPLPSPTPTGHPLLGERLPAGCARCWEPGTTASPFSVPSVTVSVAELSWDLSVTLGWAPGEGIRYIF